MPPDSHPMRACGVLGIVNSAQCRGSPRFRIRRSTRSTTGPGRVFPIGATPAARTRRVVVVIEDSPPDLWPPGLGIWGGARPASRSGRIFPVGAATTTWTGRVVIVIKNSSPNSWPPGLGVGRGSWTATGSGWVLLICTGPTARSGWIVISIRGSERKCCGSENESGHQRDQSQDSAERTNMPA